MAIPEKIKKLAHQVRSAIYGKEVRESIAESMELTAYVADEAKEVTQQLIDGSFDTGELNTQIEQRLSNLETEYAPRLTTAEQGIKDNRQYIDVQITAAQMEIGEVLSKTERTKFSDIPEPLYIAHRGGANIFPENTLEAYEGCISMGVNVIEMDVQQLSDGALGVMHDSTMERTTNKTGFVRNYSTMGFKNAKVDVLPGRDNVHPPLFEEVLSRFGNNAIYIIESKDTKSSQKIVDTLKKYRLEEYSMVTSFSLDDLLSVAEEGIPLLLATDSMDPQQILNAGVEYVGVSTKVTDEYVQSCISLGLKVIVYTVNYRYQRDYYLNLGVTGFFTDDPLYVQGKSPVLTMDPFGEQVFTHGQISPSAVEPYLGYNRGTFLPYDKFGWPTIAEQLSNFSLQGWAGVLPKSVMIDAKIVYEKITDGSRWGSIVFCTPNDFYNDQELSGSLTDGYHLLLRVNGSMEIFRRIDGVGVQIGIVQTSPILEGTQVPIKIEVTKQTIKATRLDTNHVLQVNDASHRGGYLHLGRRESGITFRDIFIS